MDTEGHPSEGKLEWTTEDSIAANREGWDIFECDGSDNGPWQICAIDEPQVWREERGVTIDREWGDDTEAWEFMWETLSDLHWKALQIIKRDNPQEYEHILAWMAKRGQDVAASE